MKLQHRISQNLSNIHEVGNPGIERMRFHLPRRMAMKQTLLLLAVVSSSDSTE